MCRKPSAITGRATESAYQKIYSSSSSSESEEEEKEEPVKLVEKAKLSGRLLQLKYPTFTILYCLYLTSNPPSLESLSVPDL